MSAALTRPRRALGVLVAAAAVLAASALAVATPAAAAGGTSYSWVGSFNTTGDDTTWTDAANWSPAGVPGNGDSVTIAPPDVTHCHAHVVGTPTVALANLTLKEIEPPGSLCEASVSGGSISVSGTFTWHGGNLDSPTTLLHGSSGVITPTPGVEDTSYLTQDLTVHGSLVLDKNLPLKGKTGQNVLISAGSSLAVASDGEMDADESNEIDGSSCCDDPPRVVNNGLLRVNGGRLEVSAVEVDNKAHLDTTSNGQLRTAQAPETAGSGANYTGDGSWQLYTATTTRLTGKQTFGRNFHFILGGHGTGGDENLGGTFTLAGSGTLDWNGGQLEAEATVGHAISVRATGVAPGADARLLDGLDHTKNSAGTPAKITNHGTISFSNGAGYTASENAQISNSNDGIVSLGQNTTLTGGCCLNPGVLANHGGLVRVGAGKHPVDLDNTRYLNYAGTTNVPSGQTLRLTGGAPSLLYRNTVTGGGTVDVRAPVAVQTSTSIAKSTTLRLTAYPGTLDSAHGAATVAGAGRLVWTGGTVSGSLTFATGSVHISGTQHKTIADPVKGTTLVRIAAPATIASGTKSAPDEFDLNGNPRLTFAGTTTIGADVIFSHGRVANSGNLRVDARSRHPVSVSATGFSNSGKLVVVDGRLQVDDDYTQTGGSTTVDKKASLRVVGSSSAIVIKGGVLGGTGQLAGPVANTGGSLRPGISGVGTLHVSGSYAQGTHASAIFELGSKSADDLIVSGALGLRGRLELTDLGSYAPTAKSVRTIAHGQSVSVDLSCTTTTGGGTSGPRARHWVAGASGHDVRLRSEAGRRTGC